MARRQIVSSHLNKLREHTQHVQGNKVAHDNVLRNLRGAFVQKQAEYLQCHDEGHRAIALWQAHAGSLEERLESALEGLGMRS